MYSLIRFFLRKILKKQKIEYKIGKKKFHNSLVDSLFPEFVEIGENFTSGPGSIILAHDASLFFHNGCYRVEKTIIGDNVFIGANAVILPGVKIGNGAIIGAGSIVTKDVKEYTVVVGNPAKEISSVKEYINKSQKRNVLFLAPESFDKVKNNQNLSQEDMAKFRKYCIEEYKKRKCKNFSEAF